MTIKEIVLAIEAKHRQEGIVVKAPVLPAGVAFFEEQVGFRLPDDFREFYFTCNGFECTEDIFNMLSLNEIIEDKSHYGKGWFYFAEYLIFSDMWSLRKNTSVGFQIYNPGDEEIILTGSLKDFLFRFLKGNVFDEGGLYDWHKETKKTHYKRKDP